MSEPELPPLKTYEHRQMLTSDEKEELGKNLRVHYENGATIQQLADKTGRSTTSIRSLLIDSGTTLRLRGEHMQRKQIAC